ncbi:MBL fold metallo-hydrolase [Streptomyces sp. NPDC002784]
MLVDDDQADRTQTQLAYSADHVVYGFTSLCTAEAMVLDEAALPDPRAFRPYSGSETGVDHPKLLCLEDLRRFVPVSVLVYTATHLIRPRPDTQARPFGSRTAGCSERRLWSELTPRWIGTCMRLGELTVHPLIDGYAIMEPEALFANVTPDELRREELLNADGLLEFPYGGFLVLGPEERIVLIDLGAGPDPGFFPFTAPRHGMLPAALSTQGITAEDVTDVVLTHLHADHIGWATVGGDVYFPRARHHVHSEDWHHYAQGDAYPTIRAHLTPLTNWIHLWEGPHTELFTWLSLRAAPGHTPGSAVAVLHNGHKHLVLVGDVLHTPAELRQPHWQGTDDWDADKAVAQRQTWNAYCRENRAQVVGPHFPGLRPVHAED